VRRREQLPVGDTEKLITKSTALQLRDYDQRAPSQLIVQISSTMYDILGLVPIPTFLKIPGDITNHYSRRASAESVLHDIL
jgi:hypothetical protein